MLDGDLTIGIYGMDKEWIFFMLWSYLQCLSLISNIRGTNSWKQFYCRSWSQDRLKEVRNMENSNEERNQGKQTIYRYINDYFGITRSFNILIFHLFNTVSLSNMYLPKNAMLSKIRLFGGHSFAFSSSKISKNFN